MTRVSFNDGWTVKPKTSIFAQLSGPGESAEPVTLPHDAVIALPRSADSPQGSAAGYTASGAFEYEKSFLVPAEYRDKRVSLEFQGVHRDAVVFVNGVFAAQRPSGYATFAVGLDPFLNYGEQNVVRVEMRVHDDSRWYAGAGIHRDTALVVTELVHIPLDGVRVTTPDVEDKRAVVEVATRVKNAGIGTEQVSVLTELVDAAGALVATESSPVTLRAGAESIVRQRLFVRDPRRWSVDDPSLYRARSTVRDAGGTIDAQETVFGIRTLQLDPIDGLRINGEVVKLRGACIHHDNGLLGSAAIGRAEERRVEILKAAGFNALRSSHNPMSQAMLDACDRLGMLVMDETFDVWAESKSSFDYSLAFPEWWERDVESMVLKDINHPSVIFYSIGNEIPETGSPLGSDWGRKIAEKIRSLDDSRFLTNSVNGFVSVLPDVVGMMAAAAGDQAAGSGGVNDAMGQVAEFMNQVSASPLVTEKTAESLSVVDAAGFNYGDARYELDREIFPNRVIIGTETFPTKIDSNWRLVEENPHVIGDFTWTGWDYLGEVGIGRTRYAVEGETPEFGAPFPWLLAWCGDIDITGHRRPASYYREIVFGLRREPYIAVLRPEMHGREAVPGQWSWSDSISSWSWNAETGAPATVEVYSDAEEVELLVNGRSAGVAPAGRDHRFRARFEVRYEPGEIVAIARRGGVESERSVLRSAATEELELAVHADRTVLRADDTDLAHVSIELRDASGNLASNRDRPVTVQVSGAGALRALGSARPDQLESYALETHHSFDGRLLAIVRPVSAGAVTVVVSAEGADAVVLELTVEAVEPRPDVAVAEPAEATAA
ncbi:glycoside hydrolase family 2 TIM barrel-domain containing protein [Herbiconiux sp. 11R-BC]|uniref:glycoside hydrolase family 2 TIM barrel-domain containing protein n=1 Tax=Herbiconiux sp. 11R-BC TaxID=3111637 RepID=UPI003C09FAB3